MHDNLEVLVKVLAEVTSILIALAVVISRLSELESQIQLNRERLRLHAELLSELGHELKESRSDRPDGRDAQERSPAH